MRVSVVGPVLNESDFIGYSIMSAWPIVDEFIYALDAESNDGTRELLYHIKEKYGKVQILETETFHPSDTKAYNAAFNECIKRATGGAIWFLHPDMICTKTMPLNEGPMAWTVGMASFAGDLKTEITGRAKRWKNIHTNQYGLHYFGAYGSQNEDFYHLDITGNAYKHYGEELSKYPYEVADSGIEINHYCEMKPFKRRLEKMKTCLKALYPHFDDAGIEEMAIRHPRVTLENDDKRFGIFDFVPSEKEVPAVFKTYEAEFSAFKKEMVYG